MSIREKLYRIVFFSDTKAGRNFDLALLYCILISFIVVVLESIPNTAPEVAEIYYYIEWGFTILFSIEYLLRIFLNPKPLKYIFSLWGLIDILAILPTYLGLFIGGSHSMQAIRIVRLMRAFRILRLTKFSREAELLLDALQRSLYKIAVFMVFMFVVVIFLGTVMYVLESANPGFSSIPQSIYWAIVTVTTVGFGDVVPITIAGKFLASLTMLIGYVIIAVPTGITAVEYSRAADEKKKTKTCAHCAEENKSDAKFCSNCGNQFSN
ncbi:MAG: ion transporter [Crocinitomicaceae bacterium]|jgi:voltage-gated potassium channel|nr:ion transporter [Crocinitomicaceae bacterium]